MSLLSGAFSAAGPAQRVHPLPKVLWLVTASVASLWPDSPLLLLAMLVTLWLASGLMRLHLRALWRIVRFSLPFCLAILVLQVALRREGPVVLDVGWLAIHRPALDAALLAVLRVQCLSVAFAQFWLWSHPTDLALLLVQCRVPYRYAFLPTLAFRAFPLLEHELALVIEGQQLRGLDLHSGLRQAIHLPRLILPFCLRTLRVGNDMALAMELRAFGAGRERTYTRSLHMRWWDWVFAVVAGLTLPAVLLYFA